MISFIRPSCLLLVLCLPVYGLLKKFRVFRAFELPLTLGDWNGLPFRWVSPFMRIADTASRVCAAAAFLCVVIAASGPVRFAQERVYSGSGTGIVFVLDVSPSMAARDLGADTRLEVARHFIRDFTGKRPGDSFGLVALGSSAALLVPPTTDHASFNARLDSLAIGELGDGTALGLGLAVAAAHLVGRTGSRSCAIMLTDGENNAGEINPKTAASLYGENGIDLYVIGVGSRGDVPLEYVDPETGKAYSGVFASDYNESALRDIAVRGGGTYISATSRDALAAVFSGIGESVSSTNSSWTRSIEESLDMPFILAALCLFPLVWFLRRIVMGALL